MTIAEQAGVGTAHLSSSSEDGYTIHGVALGSGDITVGSTQIKKLWPGDELKKAAETLEGQPLVRNHQNNAQGTVGRVTKSTYKEGVGVLYEAKIAPHYEELAKDIESGILEVSARVYHNDVSELEEDEETGALITENLFFDNLSIVSDGASPSNSVEIGEATAMAQGPSGESVAVLEQGSTRMESAELQEELSSIEEARTHPDMSAMPTGSFDDPPEWNEGDMVRWQVEPDLFGEIVHVDDEKNIVMVQIMGMDDGELDSTGFAITAGYSDIRPMTMPESKEDMSGHMDDEEEEMSSSMEEQVEELAMIDGLDINGMVMWEDKMGTIAGFEKDDGSLMIEIDVLSKDGGQFEKTGETVTKPLMEVDMAEENASSSIIDRDMVTEELTKWTVEELQEMSTHKPEWSDTREAPWSKPSLNDFTEESWDDLGSDEQSNIADHFIVSKSGFPPENFGDLALPVVDSEGNLVLNALQNAKARAGQVSGLSGDTLNRVENMIDGLANDNFEGADFGGEEENSENGQGNDLSVATLSTTTKDTMTDINYEQASTDAVEEYDDPVVMERSELDELEQKVSEADELGSKLEDVNGTLDELSENQKVLEDVDDQSLDELQQYDDPEVLSGEEYDELQSMVDDIGQIFAEELADYSPFEAEELQERFTPLELREKVEDHDDASITEEMQSGEEPDPDGGSVSEEELEGTDEEIRKQASTEELREAVARNLEDEGLGRQADKVRDGEIGLEEMKIDPEEVLE